MLDIRRLLARKRETDVSSCSHNTRDAALASVTVTDRVTRRLVAKEFILIAFRALVTVAEVVFPEVYTVVRAAVEQAPSTDETRSSKLTTLCPS